MKIISLGGGVQSSTLLLMSIKGVIDKANFAIFADTQHEPQKTYEYIDYLESICNKSKIPLLKVTKGNLANDKFLRLPLYTDMIYALGVRI